MSLFATGPIYTTRGVYDLACENDTFNRFVSEAFSRHLRGDWGDICDEDKELNNIGLSDDPEKRSRLLSRYNNEAGDIYIITEWDRSCTTILFPDEY